MIRRHYHGDNSQSHTQIIYHTISPIFGLLFAILHSNTMYCSHTTTTTLPSSVHEEQPLRIKSEAARKSISLKYPKSTNSKSNKGKCRQVLYLVYSQVLLRSNVLCTTYLYLRHNKHSNIYRSKKEIILSNEFYVFQISNVFRILELTLGPIHMAWHLL